MYQVTFTPEAELDLASLNKPIAQRVLNKIHWLADHFNLILTERKFG